MAGSADGSGAFAQFAGPQGVAVDSSGVAYVADTLNQTIRKITPLGAVSTLAGAAGITGALDGSGGNARFYNPQALTVDSSGNVYVADTFNHTIRKVTAAGTVTTLAGLNANYGAANGTNSRARFYFPAGLAVDTAGNLYVADSLNHIIRKVTPAGLVTTLAGMPGVWGSADGTNSGARLFAPEGIVVDGVGTLFVMDSGNQLIRKVAPSGTNWIVTTVAGLPGVSGSANGTGASARFRYSAGMALDSAGNLYVADAGNNAIRVSRMVTPLLQFAGAGNQGSVFWSPSAYNFLPETSASMSSGWTPVTSNVVTSGDISVLNFTSTNPAAFYRLHKP
jgi:sugar lactone lactonase YvrE